MTTALLVVDMLHDFVDGALANPAARPTIAPTARLIEAARRAGWLVIYGNDTHQPGDLEFAVFGEHALAGSPGGAVIPQLASRVAATSPTRTGSGTADPEPPRTPSRTTAGEDGSRSAGSAPWCMPPLARGPENPSAAPARGSTGAGTAPSQAFRRLLLAGEDLRAHRGGDPQCADRAGAGHASPRTAGRGR